MIQVFAKNTNDVINHFMKQIDLQSDDTMYVLGDVVDRYPDGIKILRRIMKMPNARMLMGNHEYMMLQAIGHCRNAADERANTNWKQRRHWYQNGGRVTHEQLKHIRLDARAEIFRFIRQLPVNMEVTVNGIKYKLVHASPVENYMSSYWDASAGKYAPAATLVSKGFKIINTHNKWYYVPGVGDWAWFGYQWSKGYMNGEAKDCTVTDGGYKTNAGCMNAIWFDKPSQALTADIWNKIEDHIRVLATNNPDYFKAEEHKLVFVAEVPATCETPGVAAHWKCTDCGQLFADAKAEKKTTLAALTLLATGHAYGEPVWKWNDDFTASAVFTCANDAAHTQPAAAEVTNEVTTKPTCEEEGVRTYTAKVTFEGKDYTDTKTEPVAATGHQPERKNAKDATCTDKGYTGDSVCKVCEKVLETGKQVDALGHEFKNGKCTRCGKIAPKGPVTGDSVHPAMLWVCTVSAAAAVVLLLILRKKQHSAR